jgi:hypothetical protein
VPSPVPLRVRVHPLVSFSSPPEYILLGHPSDPNAEALASNTSQGLVPIRDMSSWSPRFDEHPRPICVPPSAFLTLSAISSSNYRAGLFHPTATSGIRTSGVFLAAKPARLIDESCPHVVGESLLPVSCPTGSRSFPPRLQGVDPSSDPLWMTGGLDLPTLDPLLGFQLPWGFVRTPWKRLHVSSTHDLSCCALVVHSAAGLQRINRYPA